MVQPEWKRERVINVVGVVGRVAKMRMAGVVERVGVAVQNLQMVIVVGWGGCLPPTCHPHHPRRVCRSFTYAIGKR